MKLIFKQTKRLASLSGPLLVAKIGIPIRGLVATWIFAQLGTQTLAAGALTYSLFMAMLTFFLGVLMSSVGVYVAYATGAKNKSEVTHTLQQGLWLGGLLSLPAMLILYNTAPILSLLGQDKNTVTLAAQFAHGLAWTFIPYCILISAYKLLTNLNKTYISMLYSLWGLAVTITVSYTLAFGKFGLPAIGIAGVGWGIATAYWSQAIIIIFHISFGRHTKEYAVFKRFFTPKPDQLYKLWKIGWPIGVKYAVEFSLFFVIAAIIGVLNHKELAVYQVVLQFFMLSSCLSSGVGLGTEALVGQAIGEKQNRTTIGSTCYAGLLLSTVYIGIVAMIIFLFHDWVAHFFFAKNTNDFILLLRVFGWVVAFQLLDSLRKVMTDILTVFKDSLFLLIAETIGLWGISLPLGYFIRTYVYYDLIGFLIGLVIGLFISVIAMCVRFRYQLVRI